MVKGVEGGREGGGANSRLVGVTTAVGTLKGVHCQRIPTPPTAASVWGGCIPVAGNKPTQIGRLGVVSREQFSPFL